MPDSPSVLVLQVLALTVPSGVSFSRADTGEIANNADIESASGRSRPLCVGHLDPEPTSQELGSGTIGTSRTDTTDQGQRP